MISPKKNKKIMKPEFASPALRMAPCRAGARRSGGTVAGANACIAMGLQVNPTKSKQAVMNPEQEYGGKYGRKMRDIFLVTL
jgi:hypothetical protein